MYFLFNFGNYVRTAETKKVSNTICHKNASVGCCGSLEFSVGATLQKNCGQTYATVFESHFKKSSFQFLRQKLKVSLKVNKQLKIEGATFLMISKHSVWISLCSSSNFLSRWLVPFLLVN